MKQFQLRALPLALLCASLGASTTARAAETSPAPTIFKACNSTRTTGAGTCRAIPMPANAVGRVTSVLPLGMIQGAKASWLARGTQRTSLCYSGKNWKGVSEVVCKPVPYAKGIEGFQLKLAVTKRGTKVFSFVRKPGTKASPNDLMYAKNFMFGLTTATQAMQKIANRRQEVSTTPNAPAGTVSLTVGVGSSGCGFDDQGGEFCYQTVVKPTTGASLVDEGGFGGIGGGMDGSGGSAGGAEGGGAGGGGFDPSPFGNDGNAGDPNSGSTGTSAYDEIPIDAIPTPEWPSGYPQTGDEPGPFDHPVDDGTLGNNSGQGQPTNMVSVCLPGPIPMCVMVANVPVKASITSEWDKFWAWVGADRTTGGGDGGGTTVGGGGGSGGGVTNNGGGGGDGGRDEERKICRNIAWQAADWCVVGAVLKVDYDLEFLKTCFKNVKARYDQCLKDVDKITAPTSYK